jgi:hypothetical protein
MGDAMSKHTASFKRQYLEQCCREWWQDMDDEMVDYRTEHPDADDMECWEAISNRQIDRMAAKIDRDKENRRERFTPNA